MADRAGATGRASAVRVVHEIDELDAAHGGVLVPTMGALHAGHLALVRRAATIGRPVVVTVFVNPTQFGPGEDFERYPRTLDTDVAAAADAGADIVFAPEPRTVYPPGVDIPVPPLPEVATVPGLEDAHRPGHFAGVCQVVARLFDLARPRWAVFGEKDYQQLLVVRAMAEAAQTRWPDLEIVAHPTVRDADGLALSSRNAYLAGSDRRRALALPRSLQAVRGAETPRSAEMRMRDVLRESDLEVHYAVVREATTLRPLSAWGPPARALVAARVGPVRLIDNAPCG